MAGLKAELLLKRWNKRFAWLNAKRRIRKRQIFKYLRVKAITPKYVFYGRKQSISGRIWTVIF